MLRYRPVVKPYPSRSIFRDIVMREGPPVGECFTPFCGYNAYVKFLISYNNLDTRFDMEEFVSYTEKKYDWNPEKCKLVINEDTREEEEVYPFKTIEDLFEHEKCEDILKKFISDRLYSYSYEEAAGFKETAFNYMEDRYNGEGDATSALEFMTNREKSDIELIEAAKNEIPYLMKIINEYGKSVNTNLFTWLKVYMRIKKAKEASGVAWKANDFDVKNELIRIKTNGDFDRYFVQEKDSRDKKFTDLWHFIIGSRSVIDPTVDYRNHYIRQALMQFYYYLTLCGIDINYENVGAWNTEYIDSIICTFIPTNERYFKDFVSVDVEVRRLLQPENLFALPDEPNYFHNEEELLDVDRAIDCVRAYVEAEQVSSTTYFRKTTNKKDLALELIDKLRYLGLVETQPDLEYYDNMFDNTDVQVIDGLLAYQGDFIVMSSPYIPLYMDDEIIQFAISTYGFIFALPETFTRLTYLDIETVLKIVDSIIFGVGGISNATWLSS